MLVSFPFAIGHDDRQRPEGLYLQLLFPVWFDTSYLLPHDSPRILLVSFSILSVAISFFARSTHRKGTAWGNGNDRIPEAPGHRGINIVSSERNTLARRGGIRQGQLQIAASEPPRGVGRHHFESPALKYFCTRLWTFMLASASGSSLWFLDLLDDVGSYRNCTLSLARHG